MSDIIVEKLHTDEMLADELKAMLGVGKVRLTLGMLASLAIIRSPYLFGGKVDEAAFSAAYEVVLGDGEMDALEFHEELQREIDTAFRVFDTIVPDEHKSQKSSEMDLYSPEWFADIISQACQAMPSLTYNQIWRETPLAMVLHLVVSTARRNGAVTRRPDDIREALKQLRELRRK